MNINFEGKVAVITGGGSGIGKAATRQFAELGAAVAILDVNAAGGRETASDLQSRKFRAQFYECNIASAPQVETTIAAVVADMGRIDVAVSNAGIQRYGKVAETSEKLWDEVMDINLKGCFHLARCTLPLMVRSGGGAIVVVGSVQSVAAVGNSAAYVTSKHAVLGLARSMALDYAPYNIRVNCVCPGAIDTPMLRWAASLDPNPQRVIDTCNAAHALGRIGKAEEVARAIIFLASDWASFVTGAALLVDGGMMTPVGGMAFQKSGTGAAVELKTDSAPPAEP